MKDEIPACQLPGNIQGVQVLQQQQMFVFPCVVKGPTGWPKAPTPLTKSLPKSTFLPNPFYNMINQVQSKVKNKKIVN
ncbi:hypothetical protein OUZ56_026208 [Daphnia magna]|uniref:Uncharacterized protein n=1 Tax=Daphnia magna TaxID=35525 RepID=A0ABQ9ZL66_9CRUS|nr:hypothetical protein OUZ56_026208 [Daphnia magna]